MARADYYALLGVERGATAEEIRHAFRRQALRHHPDQNPGPESERIFQDILRAYRVLSKPDLRALYDQGPSWRKHLMDPTVAAQIAKGKPIRGKDLRYDLNVPFKGAMAGPEVTLTYIRAKACPPCQGTGRDLDAAPTACPACDGQGTQGPLLLKLARPCPSCAGKGTLLVDPCPACDGQGLMPETATLTVTLPPALHDGQRIRLAQEGDEGLLDGEAGDLYIVVRIIPDPHLRREKDDIWCSLPLSYIRAALGGEVRVPTLEGSLRMRIPAGTQHGKLFRLTGQGLLRPKGGQGDQMVEIRIVIPSSLEPDEREALEELDRLGVERRVEEIRGLEG